MHERSLNIMLNLYYASGSCSFAAHLALARSGASYKLTPVRLATGEQRADPFLKINPHGKIPVLAIGEATISELPAILTFIAASYPDAGLLPIGDPLRMARAAELVSWFATTVQVTFSQVFRPDRFTDDESVKDALRAEGPARVRTHLDEIERLYAAEDWLLGPEPTVIDFYALVFLNWAPRVQLDPASFRRWHEQAQKLVALPFAKQALAAEDWTPAFVTSTARN